MPGISSVVGGGAKTSNPRQHVYQQGLQQGIHTAGVRFTGVPFVGSGIRQLPAFVMSHPQHFMP